MLAIYGLNDRLLELIDRSFIYQYIQVFYRSASYGHKPNSVEIITAAARTHQIRIPIPILQDREQERLKQFNLYPYGAVMEYNNYFYAPILCGTEGDGIAILKGIKPYVEETNVRYYVCPIVADLHVYRITREDGIEKYRVLLNEMGRNQVP